MDALVGPELGNVSLVVTATRYHPGRLA